MSSGTALKYEAFDCAEVVIETSLIELVLAACEWSDDQTGIADLVDSLVETGDVRLTGLVPAAP